MYSLFSSTSSSLACEAALVVITIFLIVLESQEGKKYFLPLCPLPVLFRCLIVSPSGPCDLEALRNEESHILLKTQAPGLAQKSLTPGGGMVVSLLSVSIKGLSYGS